MSELQSSPLFDISITVDPPHQLGATPLGTRRIVPVTGGSFSGQRLRGTVIFGSRPTGYLCVTTGRCCSTCA